MKFLDERNHKLKDDIETARKNRAVSMSSFSLWFLSSKNFIKGAEQNEIKNKYQYPQNAGVITRTMLVALAVIESLGIYALVVALLLIFVV